MSSELELQPHAVIVANDLERFTAFAALLEKNGFPCRVLRAFPDETPRAGTVYFVSFNLTSSPAIALGKKIEQAGLACIVFAEETGVQTAAKLSSAKMSQTLQHPYTEKNFLMAVQTIVKNRKAQFEKELRKRQFDERLKANQKNVSAMTDAGLIVQERAEQIVDDSARVFKNDASAMHSAMQAGASGKGFFAIQQAPKPAAGRSVTFDTAAPVKKEHAFNVLSYADMKKKRTDAQDSGAGDVHANQVGGQMPNGSEVSPEQDGARAARESASPPPAYERPMSHFWFVLGLCLVGSVFCLYCVYQILFT